MREWEVEEKPPKEFDKLEIKGLINVNDIKEKKMSYIFPNLVPRGQIVLLAGDGGSAKSFLTCQMAAAITSGGKVPFLNHDYMPFEIAGSRKVLFFNAEDSMEIVTRKRLREAGADLSNIITLNPEAEENYNLTFGSKLLEEAIDHHRPVMVIFDPIQSFLPPEVNMSQRNQMRASTKPLMRLSNKYNVTFLIVLHTNKSNAWGRKRIADSSDLWDGARSVLIAGNTSDGNVKYLSHEKNNYGEREDTILFDIFNNKVRYLDTTYKTDKDFVQESIGIKADKKASPAKDEAKEAIMYIVNKHPEGIETVEVKQMVMEDYEISEGTYNRATSELVKAKDIEKYQTGSGKETKRFFRRTLNKW